MLGHTPTISQFWTLSFSYVPLSYRKTTGAPNRNYVAANQDSVWGHLVSLRGGPANNIYIFLGINPISKFVNKLNELREYLNSFVIK